jgi:GntR family transcriptional regulator
MIEIDTASFIPFYEQIKQQVRRQIGSKLLRPRDALPSIRDLASSLLLNPNTVARAYRELEMEGLIVTRQGKGCFVSQGAPGQARGGALEELDRLLDEALAEAERLGLESEAIRRRLEDREKRRSGGRKGRKRT